jgi:hypothetical protein
MKAAQIALARTLQSLKVIPSLQPGQSLADALYLHLVSMCWQQPEREPQEMFEASVARAFAAAQIGELARSDVASLAPAARTALARALHSSLPPQTAGAVPLERVEAVLPVLDRGPVPGWAESLTRRMRAGFEDVEGVRTLGPRPESQAAHAYTTAVIAWLHGGLAAALIGLVHNAHLAFFPDIPHRVEARLGSERLAEMESRARRAVLRSVPREVRHGRGAQRLFQAMGSREALAIADEADFVDRTLWLQHIRPPWLEGCTTQDAEAVLCNRDQRYAVQAALLPRLLGRG